MENPTIFPDKYHSTCWIFLPAMLFFLRVYYLEILVIFHHDFTFWFAFLLGVPLQTVKPDCQLGFYPQGIFQSIWTSVSFRVYIFVVVKNDQKHLQTTTFDTKKGCRSTPNMQINHALPPLQGGCQTKPLQVVHQTITRDIHQIN